VGFVVDKAALGQVFSEYVSVLPANYSTNCFTPITRASTINRPVVASVLVDLVPLHPKKKKEKNTQTK
jgi:hypothetical protein